MPNLNDLKQKWFIDVTGASTSFPPSSRHSGSKQVQPYTDGNIVIPLIDGESYMSIIRQSILDLPTQSEVWFLSLDFAR